MSLVKFKEDTHQYFAGDRELISVSAFTHRFEQEKDWKKIAAKVAKRDGRTVQQVLKEWEVKRVKGTEAGTIVHKIKENETLADGVYTFDDQELGIKESEFEGSSKISFNIDEIENGHIYPELMIYDLEYGICGQSDEVVIANNSINILDYKTDKSIEFKAFSSQWTDPEKLKKPVHHLDACNGNIYSLKMSLYMYMLWKANKGRFKPGKIILKWVPIEREPETGIPVLYDGVPKILFEKHIELPYRKKEVMAMLETLKK